MPKRQLRDLDRFGTLDAAVGDAKQLLNDGYTSGGRWTLGQVTDHLATFTNASLDGFAGKSFPRAVQFLLRKLIVNDFVLSQPMPRGFPTLRSLRPPTVDDAVGVQRFAAASDRFEQHRASGAPFADEPFLGQLPPDVWQTIHLMHATHHLSFLQPKQ
jgi:hypothetical protein